MISPIMNLFSTRTRARVIASSMVAVTVLALALDGCSTKAASSPAFDSAPVVRGALAQRVTASGTLSALRSVDVGSQVSGKVMALYVDFNAPVRKGQLVAEIDPTLYRATLRQAEGELASARANVILRRQNLERKRTLVPLRAASQFDLDQATAELAQAEATVVIREASAQSARANLAFCRITAPVDGIVISRKVDVGQTVIAAMNTPVLFTVAQDLRTMNISAAVSESDVGQVRVGQPVAFTVDAFPDDVFRGEVTQIRKAPTTTQNVVTYECLITLQNPGQKLFPGMTADVTVLVAERTNVLKVPNTALRFTPPAGAGFETPPPATLERGQRLVYVASADGRRLRALVVRTGISDGVESEIMSGLADASAVVTASRSIATAKASAFPPAPPPQ